MPKCGAQLRGKPGVFCERDGMANGRCDLHGGKSTGRPVINGTGMRSTKRSLKERIAEYERIDVEPLERAENVANALLDIYIEANQDKDNFCLEDLQGFFAILEKLTKVSTARANIRNQTTLTAAEVQLLQVNVAAVIREFVDVDKQGKAISRLRSLTAPSKGGRRSDRALPESRVVEGEVISNESS